MTHKQYTKHHRENSFAPQLDGYWICSSLHPYNGTMEVHAMYNLCHGILSIGETNIVHAISSPHLNLDVLLLLFDLTS